MGGGNEQTIRSTEEIHVRRSYAYALVRRNVGSFKKRPLNRPSKIVHPV